MKFPHFPPCLLVCFFSSSFESIIFFFVFSFFSPSFAFFLLIIHSIFFAFFFFSFLGDGSEPVSLNSSQMDISSAFGPDVPTLELFGPTGMNDPMFVQHLDYLAAECVANYPKGKFNNSIFFSLFS